MQWYGHKTPAQSYEDCETTCKYELLHTTQREARHDVLTHGRSSKFWKGNAHAALFEVALWLSNRAAASDTPIQGWSLYELSETNSRSLVAAWTAP